MLLSNVFRELNPKSTAETPGYFKLLLKLSYFIVAFACCFPMMFLCFAAFISGNTAEIPTTPRHTKIFLLHHGLCMLFSHHVLLFGEF